MSVVLNPIGSGKRVHGKTQANGEFHSGDIAAGRYLATCNVAQWLSPDPQEVTLEPGDQVDLGEWVLRKGAGATGKALLEGGGIPHNFQIALYAVDVEHTQPGVRFYCTIDRTQTTYSAGGLRAGRYKIRATYRTRPRGTHVAGKYVASTEKRLVFEGQPFELAVDEWREFNLVLPRVQAP